MNKILNARRSGILAKMEEQEMEGHNIIQLEDTISLNSKDNESIEKNSSAYNSLAYNETEVKTIKKDVPISIKRLYFLIIGILIGIIILISNYKYSIL